MGSTDPGLGENFVLKHGCDFCVFGDKPEGCCSFHYSLLFLTFPDWTKCLTEKKKFIFMFNGLCVEGALGLGCLHCTCKALSLSYNPGPESLSVQ